MTATTLFTPDEKGTKQLRTGAIVGGVAVTVKEMEQHTYSSNATKLALESGAVVTDHAIVDPETVAVTFTMTNAGQGASQAKDAFAAFVKMLQSRQLVELITEHAVYSNMLCVNITPMHSAPYKGALNCTATFQKINFMQLVSAGRAPKVLKRGAKKTGSGPVQAGKVEPEKVNRSQAAAILKIPGAQ